MSERSAVQDPMLKYAREIGWEYVPPEQALAFRNGETGLYFYPVLEAQLLRLNPGVVDAGRAGEIVRQLNLLPPNIEGNRVALEWLRGEQSVFVPAEKRQRNVRLVDFENPERNQFQVTDEWRHKSTIFANRADVVFLINGIPVAIAETKAAGKRDGLTEGIDQVRRYHRETPEMLIAPQVFEVTELLNFYYAATWNTSRKNLFDWREELVGAVGSSPPSAVGSSPPSAVGSSPPSYEHKVKAFFERARFLRVLRDYILFLRKDDQLSKIILRQHQTRAVEKVLERAHDPTKRRGLIWHTQGSGKTLTMLTIAEKLLRGARDGEKPTVLMLVDRNELEQQLFRNIEAAGIATPEVAQSKNDLRRLLAQDYRGLIVSMIHKFDKIDEKMNPRESVIVLVDEAHRTTGGSLGNYLMGALPNATYIGFTGTPIDKLAQGQGTFKVFGRDDETGYLDKYSIRESVEDGTTVRLNYALAPSELRVDRETLEREFLKLAEAEGVSDIDELNAILDRAVELKELMKADDRVNKIAALVAKHFRENVEPMGFKAFLVAVDREACALYKNALDKVLPPEYSQVVFSPAHNDQAHLRAFHHDEAAEKEIRKKFIRKDEFPKILIVTEKLLTGFDAPILYCMYLDKPMRDHVLLQAIARVNRPYEDDDGLVKPYGFVMDFVGIFEKLENALAFDADVVASVIQNIDVLRELFKRLMRETARQYLDYARGWDDKAKERAIQFFEDKERRQEFFGFFKQLQNLYDILSPDAELHPYIRDYEALTELYELIRNAYALRPYLDQELTEKTKKILREQTTTYSVELPNAVQELGVAELAALKASDASDTVKVLNLSKALANVVARESRSKPYLVPIGERAEALRQAYEERQLTTQEALEEFEKLAQEVVQADAERAQLGVDGNAFAIYKTLAPMNGGISAAQAEQVEAVFARFPDYRWNQAQEKGLRAQLYLALRPLVGTEGMIAAANALLKLERV